MKCPKCFQSLPHRTRPIHVPAEILIQRIAGQCHTQTLQLIEKNQIKEYQFVLGRDLQMAIHTDQLLQDGASDTVFYLIRIVTIRHGSHKDIFPSYLRAVYFMSCLFDVDEIAPQF